MTVMILGLLLAAAPTPMPDPYHSAGLPSDPGDAVRRCDSLNGRIDEPLPQNLRLTDGPGSGFNEVGRLPPTSAGPHGPVPTSIRVVASDYGELQIRDDRAGGRLAWLDGFGVSFGVSASLGYARPDANSEIIVRTSGGTRLDAHAELVAITACDGKWVLGTWRVDDSAGMSWDKRIQDWPAPPLIRFWAMSCDRTEPGCETPAGSRPPHHGPRYPIP